MQKLFYYLTSTAVGAITAATQILVIRQVIPIIGSTPFITSLVIGFAFFGLALGYYSKHHNNSIQALQRNLMLIGIWLGITLAYGFIAIFFAKVEINLLPNSTYVLLTYLLISIVPLHYLIGQILIILANMTNNFRLVFACSALGAGCGAVLTTILFMSLIGVGWTVLLASVGAIGLALAMFQKHKIQYYNLIILVFAVPTISWCNLFANSTNLIADNAYANYRRVDNTIGDYSSGAVGKALVINNSASSFVDYKALKAYPYIEAIKKILFQDLKLHDQNILVLGAGGFSISAAGTNHNNFTYVDIDPSLQKIVQKNYLDKINGEFIAKDARDFLRTNQKKYNVIIADTFAEHLNVPTHLLTKEYYSLLDDNLTADGIVVFNTIISPTLSDQYSRGIDNTIRAVFNSCVVMPREYTLYITNVMYVCKKHPSTVQDVVYHDNERYNLADIAAVNSGMSVNKSPTKP